MSTIFKYTLMTVDRQELLLPAGASILAVALQEDINDIESIVLYAVVNRESVATEARVIRIVGTGQEMDFVGGRFIGTVLEKHRPLVWHVFDCGYPNANGR